MYKKSYDLKFCSRNTIIQKYGNSYFSYRVPQNILNEHFCKLYKKAHFGKKYTNNRIIFSFTFMYWITQCSEYI